MSPLASIVLAGGRGRRLASVTGGVPKQFWAPPGRRSLLEETHTRIAPLSDSTRTLTVVADSHRPHVEHLRTRTRDLVGEFVYQPADRGTATGVLLAATMLSSADPDAVVLITPSDHGVGRVGEFRAGVRAAAAHVRARPADVVLLGVHASSPVGDYGWIVPAHRVGRGAAPVVSFVEKPTPDTAERLFAAGAVWNTMVMVAKAGALLGLYRRHAPELAAAFAQLTSFSPAALHERRISRLYESLPSLDFSQDILARASGLQCMAWGATMGWTDLGTPERLSAWLTCHEPEGRRPLKSSVAVAEETGSLVASALGARRLA